MTRDVRRWVLEPLAWLVLLLPPVVVGLVLESTRVDSPAIPAQRVIEVRAQIPQTYDGQRDVPFVYDNPITSQRVRTDVPVFDPSQRPRAGSTIDAMVDRENPDTVVVPGSGQSWWYVVSQYIWLPAFPLLTTIARRWSLTRSRRLAAGAGTAFAMVGVLAQGTWGRRHLLHLYPLDAGAGALPLCSVPLVDAWLTGPGEISYRMPAVAPAFPVLVKGSPRPFGRVVPRHGPDVLWPAQRAMSPVPQPRPSEYVEQLSAAEWQLEDDDAGLAGPLAIAAFAASLLLVALVTLLTLLGAAQARAAYATGDSVIAEVTGLGDGGLELEVAYEDGQGRSRDAVAFVDYPEDYSVGRRYPAVVLPDDSGSVRLRAEPYDAVEPVIWGFVPAGATGSYLLCRLVGRPSKRPPKSASRGQEGAAGTGREQGRRSGRHRRANRHVMDRAVARSVAVLLLVSSALLLLAAKDFWDRSEGLLQRGVTVTGEVMDPAVNRYGDLRVAYTTQAGERRERSGVSAVRDYELGEDVQLIYDPLAPKAVETAEWGVDHAAAYAWGAAGGVFLVLGVISGVYAVRSDP